MSEGLSQDVVWAIAQDRAGAIWLGTKEGGVNRLSANCTLTRFTTKDGLSDSGVESIFEDTDGTMWFGTRRGGLNHFVNGATVVAERMRARVEALSIPTASGRPSGSP